MKKATKQTMQTHNQRGAAGLMVTLLIPVFLGVAALGIDVTHRVILSNELQNAADAGALAGAARLYSDDGTIIDTGANLVAQQVAFQNLTTRVPQTAGESNRLAPEVAVDDAMANTGDVKRGHWTFGPPVQSNLARGFYENASTATVDLFGVTSADLDENVNFINAVRVVAHRENTPIVTFFARIFGITDTQLSREAVAYIGFAGRLKPQEVDQPIAICEDTLLDPDDGSYNCNIGRMINSGTNETNNETGGWTDFNQEGDPCAGGTNAQAVRNLVCAQGNPYTLLLGRNMATSGGEIQVAFDDLVDCWNDNSIINTLTDSDIYEWCYESQRYSTLAEFIAAQPASIQNAIGDTPNYIRRTWGMTLPVITCPSNNVGTCEIVRGAVEVDVAWINRSQDPQYNGVPRALFGPNCDTILWDRFGISDGSGTPMPDGTQAERINMWDSFVSDPDLNLQNVDGSFAPYALNSIYFLPNCDVHVPTGVSGGENFGILARIPVLVCPDPASHDPNDTNNCLGGQ